MKQAIDIASKPVLLVVGDYSRDDYLLPFEKLSNDFIIYFLEYISPKQVIHPAYKRIGTAIFWKDFSNVFDLLNKIKPAKVIFYYIESYFHTILNIACKLIHIKTYHIEHGLRDMNINVKHEQIFKTSNLVESKLYRLKIIISQFYTRLASRIFLINSIKLLPESIKIDFKQFMALRSKRDYLYTLLHSPPYLTLVDSYISYSPKVFEVHKYYHTLTDLQEVHYIGIPLYDHLALLGKQISIIYEDYILFIDQGLPNRGLLGWTETIYSTFIKDLCSLCSKHHLKLFIKPHPSHTCFSKKYSKFFTKHTKIINNKDFEVVLPCCPLVVGFFSTLLLPIIAYTHTSVITLENHPIGRIDVSKSFVEAGVAHPVYNLDELHTVLQDVEALHQKQLPHKAKFTEEWMYKFDGKAGDRLRDILLRDDL